MNNNVKAQFVTPVSYEDATERAEKIVSVLTLDEKISLIGGHKDFFIRPFPEYGIPLIYMTDATQGVHIRNKLDQSLFKQMEKSTSFPCPLLLASTWNTQLAYEYAYSIGEECRTGGIHFLLGPGLNLYRNSQCGRNFEYFGEDPCLISALISKYITGVQNTGTIATLKHFVCNNTDYYRRRSNSIVDERTLNEIYLPGFKAGIDAGAMAVMTSYNQLNGEWCGQSEYVINQLLRTELGFKWLVMTDWSSVWDAKKVIGSGQDIEMPEASALASVNTLIKTEKMTTENIDRMILSIIRTCIAMGFYDRYQKQSQLLDKFPQHEEVALNTAREGIVLLKNNSVLPLIKGKKILATGEYLDKIALGGGAARVEGYNQVLLKDALLDEFGDNIKIIEHPSDNEIKNADVVLLSIGTFDSEGWDRSFSLPKEIDDRVIKTALLNPNTIVVINSGSGIQMTAWIDKVAAVVYAWYPGQIGNKALTEILSGKTNPSGKLPVTIEKKFEDSPAYGYLPKGESLYYDWPKDELQRPVYDVNYKEGIFVGYRWYDKNNIEPLFPFGFGLSYTTFNYKNLNLSSENISANDTLIISVEIENTGNLAGKEIVQLYIEDTKCSVERPLKELKGFQKIYIEAGKTSKVEFLITEKELSFWDVKSKKWKAEPGEFKLKIGSSSRDIKLEKLFNLKK